MNDTAKQEAGALAAALGGRSIVLVGMMGAGKTSVGRRLAQRLGLPFVDADAEIEAGARMTIPEIFERFGEPYFRDGERKVIARLLDEGPKVLATGGGAFMNAATRERIAATGVSIWLKPEFEVLLRRVRKRSNRPLLQTADPEATLRQLLEERSPTYALADLTIESRDGPHDAVVETILEALRRRASGARRGDGCGCERSQVALGERSYKILIGEGLIASRRARISPRSRPARDAPSSPTKTSRRCISTRCRQASRTPGIAASVDRLPAGRGDQVLREFARVSDALIAAHIERRDLVVALGGGVIGDLAGFCAASLRRGVRLVQIPTTLLAQVDSSVGGKTAINSPLGKNLIGAFHQPSLVLADSTALDTLSAREFRAGYAEVAKYGLIDDRDFFEWLEAHWRDVFAGGPARPARHRGELRGQGARRRLRRDRAGRARAAQSRPYFRPRLRGADPLRQRQARAWRGRRGRHGLRVPLLARSRPLLGPGCDPRREPSARGRPADAHRRKSRACRATRTRSSPRCGRTRRSSAAGSPSSSRAASAKPSSPRDVAEADVRAFLQKELRAD